MKAGAILATLCAAGFTTITVAKTQLVIGAKAPRAILSGDGGGLVKGGDWDSDTLKGKIHILFYVDPDEKEANQELERSLKRHEFPDDEFASVAIINMKATWLPNAVISMSLDAKQKDYPRTIYVEDKQKTLVKKWGLADDSYHVVLFDKEANILFEANGQLPQPEIDRLIKLIYANLKEATSKAP